MIFAEHEEIFLKQFEINRSLHKELKLDRIQNMEDTIE